MNVWLSLICCQMYTVAPGSPEEAEARRKGMVLVPPEDVEEVRDMTMVGRRRWGLAHGTELS